MSAEILANLKSWIAAEAAKIKAALPAFEAAAVKDFETAAAEVEKYGGPIAVAFLAAAKEIGLPQLQAWAAANLPILEAEIAARLTAVGITGTAAATLAETLATSAMSAIVTAVTALVAVPK